MLASCRAATTTTKAAASSSLPALGSLASVDGGGAAVIPSNTLNNNFNAAVDLSSLFGGYNKIGEHGGGSLPAETTSSHLGNWPFANTGTRN